MAPYTIDLLREDGSVHETRVIHCEHDDEAIDRVGSFDHPHAMDVRQADRHVVRFPPWPTPRPRSFRNSH
jgi:hypothetical protein